MRRSHESSGISFACKVQQRLGQPSSSSWWCINSCRMTYRLSGAPGLMIARGTPLLTREVPCNVDGNDLSMTTRTRFANSPNTRSSVSLKKSVNGCCWGFPKTDFSTLGSFAASSALCRRGKHGRHPHFTITHGAAHGTSS